MESNVAVQADSKQTPTKPKSSFVGKAAIYLGSLASGVAAGMVYVNKKLYENLAHALLATADSHLEAMMTPLNNVFGNATPGSREEQFKNLLGSLPQITPDQAGLEHRQATRRDLNDASTVLGEALNTAQETGIGQDALKKIEFHRIAQQKYWDYADQHPESVRMINPLVQQEYDNLRLANQIGTGVDLEARAALAKETVRHVPWHKKIALNGIQLSKGQKIGTGAVFATVTGIAAGSFYKLNEKNMNNKLSK